MSTPRTSRLPSPAMFDVDDGFDHRHGDAHRRRGLHASRARPRRSPSRRRVTCSSVLPAMRSTVCDEARTARSGSPCACRRTPRRRARCRRSSAASQHVLAEVRPADQPQQDHRPHVLRRSRPSRSAMVRGQLSATFMSCVTMTTVEPRRLVQIADEREDFARRCACRDCRSARRPAESADRPTARARSRRAGARRRRVPRAGACRRGRAARASSSSRARSSTFSRGQPRRCSGRPTFSRQDSVGSRLKNWKMKPILSRRIRSLIVGQAGQRLSVDPSCRRSGGRGRRPD